MSVRGGKNIVLLKGYIIYEKIAALGIGCRFDDS